MRQRIYCWLYALAIIGWLLQPVSVMAITSLEVEHPCSLTLHYAQEGSGFSDLNVHIYRVAEAFEDGTFDLVSPFSGYPVNIHGISSQVEWKTVATTLSAYIAAEGVEPSYTEKTDDSGTAVFTGLTTGLYLVGGAIAENDSGMYVFDSFMVYLPIPQEDDSFKYDVEAKPKCLGYTPQTEYKVVKLWKDSGYADDRPVSVTVDILKDGVLQETQILSAENNWTYTWQVPDGKGVWTVTEKDVPDEYSVAINFYESTFMITNTHTLPGGTPPTGDISVPWLYMIAMCLSGFVLLIWGMNGKRGHNHEQKA